VTILAGELLKEAKGFVEDGLNSQVIISGFKEALQVARDRLEQLAVQVHDQNRRECLLKCAMTSLNSKLLSSYKEHFAELVVGAVEKLDPQLLDKDLVGVKMVTGGSITDSFMVDGVAFKKTFSYAGFE
jgi:T-complex protein 1 subunit eta